MADEFPNYHTSFPEHVVDKFRLKTFRFHWLGGKVETAKGFDVADAFRKAGYGGGAIRALDWVEEVKGKEKIDG